MEQTNVLFEIVKKAQCARIVAYDVVAPISCLRAFSVHGLACASVRKCVPAFVFPSFYCSFHR